MDQQGDCRKNARSSVIFRFQHDYKLDDGAHAPTKEAPGASSETSEQSTVRIAVYLMSEICLTMDVERNATAQQIVSAIQSEPELALSRAAAPCSQPVFAIWLCSPQLEVQLGPSHKPLELAKKWTRLIGKYGSQSYTSRSDEEPVLFFRKNVFLPRKDEEQIKEPKIIELLYSEAKKNVLDGRYPCESQARCASLGALQARIELGAYNVQAHTLAFFRKHRGRFLPHHYNSPSLLFGLGFGLGLVGGKGAPEARLLEQYKRIPSHSTANANPRKLMKKYLEFCWGLPCYGAAFFHGQIEKPVRGLASWITNCDLPVLIAINTVGVHIVDNSQCSLLLGLKYSELNWEMAKPSDENNPDCLPCLFLQFPVRENGARVYKILQVFSRQAIMMDTLISGFAENSRQSEAVNENTNCNYRTQDSFMLSNAGAFTNKLSKLTLATFDDEGLCIGQMGSWSFQ
ncbi:putative FERM domain-containing protein FRMD8P1 [Phymastichus coffea]|uniref:putative FERM domain-containing protein FRMD8P1 n=1 Tax=Phymastichus coffea TaxID=108790 RepID=UPI00273C4EAD|nr:putative FERM domain-containing protein FRMD8P1 [Phymastichus coffea]